MENKKLSISLTLILSIIFIIVIVALSIGLYLLNDNNSKLNEEIQTTNAEVQKLKNENQKLTNEKQDLENEIQKLSDKNKKSQETQNIVNNATQALESTKIDSIKELAFNFAAAVYLQDWDALEDIATEQVINELKQYNVTNMDVDLSTLEENPNEPGNYYCYDSYDINYKGSTNAKDFSLGRLLCIDKIDNKYVVTTFCATAL